MPTPFPNPGTLLYRLSIPHKNPNKWKPYYGDYNETIKTLKRLGLGIPQTLDTFLVFNQDNKFEYSYELKDVDEEFIIDTLYALKDTLTISVVTKPIYSRRMKLVKALTKALKVNSKTPITKLLELMELDSFRREIALIQLRNNENQS